MDGQGVHKDAVTRVLVIDDEAPIRLLCRVNLEAEGMEVLEARDGPGGLEQARAERPDVILLDVMMPGLDGWAVAEELIDDDTTREIPIVSRSSASASELDDRARSIARAASFASDSSCEISSLENSLGSFVVAATRTAWTRPDAISGMNTALSAPTRSARRRLTRAEAATS